MTVRHLCCLVLRSLSTDLSSVDTISSSYSISDPLLRSDRGRLIDPFIVKTNRSLTFRLTFGFFNEFSSLAFSKTPKAVLMAVSTINFVSE